MMQNLYKDLYEKAAVICLVSYEERNTDSVSLLQ